MVKQPPSIRRNAFSACHPGALQAAAVDVDLLGGKGARPWLRTDWNCGRTFADKYGPYLDSKHVTYVTMEADAEQALMTASHELHRCFLDATAHVLGGGLGTAAPELFGVPSFLWPRLQASWRRSGGAGSDLLAARFDMTLTKEGPKCYEYNCDSASCLFECAYTQDAYAQAVGAAAGRSAGHDVHRRLVETWRRLHIVGPLHILCDDADAEERYHAEYMKAAAEEAGIACKLVVGDPSLSELAWATDGSGDIQDAEGAIVRTIWKTWSWRTVVAQLEAEGEPKGELGQGAASRRAPSLADVLLHPRARTFEPLWTLIPSSKAILPVLWKLFPRHPCLLEAHFCLTPHYFRSGYAIKPINGRGGAGVRLVSGQPGHEQVEVEKSDESGLSKYQDSVIYQQLCPLPCYGQRRAQLSPWIVGGSYAGTVLRVDEKDVLDLDSPVCPLRIVGAEIKTNDDDPTPVDGIEGD